MAKSHLKVGRSALKAKILDGLRDAVLLVNEHGRVVDANLAARELLPAGVKEPALSDVIGDSRVQIITDRVLTSSRSGDTEISLPNPIGKTFEVSVTPLPHHEEPSKSWAMLTLHDVTEARRLEQIRADFVSNVSHELRSPLSSMIGFIETLQGPARDKPADRDRFLAIMADEARRMTRLVEDLLSLSRVESNEHRRPGGIVRLGDILRAVAGRLDSRAQQRNITIDITCPDAELVVHGDSDQLNQLVENLLDNALKYGNPGSTVTVELVALDKGLKNAKPVVRLSVRDQSPGIEAHHLDRLTERFYRVDAGRSRIVGGTGLGLAVVKHIVNRHRGTLSIQSKMDQGSQFTVLLPRAEMPPADN